MDVARQLEIWGSHGREHLSAEQVYTLYPPTAEQRLALDRLQTAIEGSLAGVPLRLEATELSIHSHDRGGVIERPEPLERKPASIAIHWRGLNPASQTCLQASVEAAYGQLGSDSIERLAFASGVEFRAAGCSKGSAVESVLSEVGPEDAVAYLGDDITDEDAFQAMRGRGSSLLVGTAWRRSGASYWIRPPGELIRFLAAWVA